MHVKRIFELVPGPDGQPQIGPDGRVVIATDEHGRQKFAIKVLSAPDDQRFAPNQIEKATAEGWLSQIRGQFIVHALGGDIVYRIVSPPGVYCDHCGVAVEKADGAAHVKEHHPGIPAPDPVHPLGYGHRNSFQCAKVEGSIGSG